MNLSIKNVPEDVVRRLRQRAARRHRSLQGELLAIIDEAVQPEQELSPLSCWRRCVRSACARPATRPRLSGPTVTGVKVIDASALAALVFSEPEAGEVVNRLEGARLAAPSLLDFELANVCLTKMRREPGKRDAVRAAFRLGHRMKVKTVAVDHAAVLDLAEATGLTAYDASYLWLARELKAELVTLDRKLAAASL